MRYRIIGLVMAALATLGSCGKMETRKADSSKAVPAGTVRHYSVFSSDLNRTMKTTIWLPFGYDESKTYPFLYLLHGSGDDNDSGNSKGGASYIADKYVHEGGVPMVIIMPDALRSFYVGDFETYMFGTLMPALEEAFHCNGKRAVAGLSMGGYGTLYYSLKYPDLFTYGYAMSPASDLAGFRVLAAAHEAYVYPKLTIESGTQDGTVKIEGVRELAQMLVSSGLQCDFIERSGGHDWKFWQVCLEKALVKIGNSFK